MTDIFSIVPAERAIQILHPGTGAPVGLSITLRPDSHPKVQAALRQSVNARLVARNKRPGATDDHDRIELLVSAIAGWEWQGDLTFHGDKQCGVHQATGPRLSGRSQRAQRLRRRGLRHAFPRSDDARASDQLGPARQRRNRERADQQRRELQR